MGSPKLNKTTLPMNPNFGIWTTPRLLSALFGLDNENTACGDLHLYSQHLNINNQELKVTWCMQSFNLVKPLTIRIKICKCNFKVGLSPDFAQPDCLPLTCGSMAYYRTLTTAYKSSLPWSQELR